MLVMMLLAGKTFLFRAITRYMREKGVGFHAAGFMGSCAATMGENATTIHSLFSLPIFKSEKDADSHKLQPVAGAALTEMQELFKDTRVLFLDEMSTISPHLLAFIDRRCQSAKQNELPFGGLSVRIMVTGVDMENTTDANVE